MLKKAIILILLMGYMGCAPSEDVQVTDAWVRAIPPSRDVTAAFLVIENKTDQAKILLSVESDAAETVELHTMKYVNEMMKMQKVDQIEIPAQSKGELKPGGDHIMMFGVNRPLVEGDSLSLSLRFADQTTQNVTARIKKFVRPTPKSRPSS